METWILKKMQCSTNLKYISQHSGVVHPLYESVILVEWNNTERPDVEVAPAGIYIFRQKPVDHGIQVHHTRIFSEVIFGFAQEFILLSVTADNANDDRAHQ